MDKRVDPVDPVRKLVANAIVDKSLNMNVVSRRIGKNHAYIFQYLNAGKPRILPEDVREALAPILGVEEAALRSPRDQVPPRTKPNATIEPRSPALDTWGRIPVYGQAIGGVDGRFVFNGQKIADVLAPPAVAGVRDAYAVYVVGESMEPRYKAGETAFVHPYIPVRRGDFVVVQIQGDDGDAPFGYIKEFVSMDERRLRLKQLNPAETLEFPRKAVISVHKIVMAG